MLIRWSGTLLVATAVFCGGVAARDVLTTLPPASKQSEQRHALVIGNANYTYGALKNPLNDARAIAHELSQAGFEVLLVEDATQPVMQRAIRRFGDAIQQGGVGLFYYAGHGMQVKGRNFLVPVNAEIDREYEIEYSSVDVNMVLAMMDAARNPLNIVILDACRNNPFARSFRVAATGLARMDAPAGTFIAFATAPGAVASDGPGANGIYTKHLLANLGRPGLPIEHLFKQVRIGVMTDTQGEQTPWESSSLRGEFSFYPGAAAPAPVQIETAVQQALDKAREEQRHETEQLIRAALDRQRRELEQQGLRFSETPKPPAEYVAPLASLAPSAAEVPVRRLPVAGDSWTYRLNSPGAKQRSYVVTVVAASGSGVLDHFEVESGAGGQFAHTAGQYLAAQGPSLFSPYLSQFSEPLRPGRQFSSIAVLDDKACKSPYLCTARGRVAGIETITLPAGRFETTKVVIEHDWQPRSIEPGSSSYNAELWGRRVLTVWYSHEAKRAVRVSSRLTQGRLPPVEANFDLELVAYQLNR
jgi:hypothetical protein